MAAAAAAVAAAATSAASAAAPAVPAAAAAKPAAAAKRGGGAGGLAGSGGTGGTAGSGGSPGDAGTPADHVLISEVGIQPGGAEFVEIYNPTSAAVDLSDYYLADNSAYYKITAGPWNPSGTPGTDFLAQFPSGTSIPAGGVLVVASEPASGNDGFETIFGSCPDFTLNSTGAALSCGGGSVPAMTIPTNGSVGSSAGALISNEREMIVLFSWDGSASTVKDVDYVTWGTTFDANTRIDKTGQAGYQNDTDPKNAEIGESGRSRRRRRRAGHRALRHGNRGDLERWQRAHRPRRDQRGHGRVVPEHGHCLAGHQEQLPAVMEAGSAALSE